MKKFPTLAIAFIGIYLFSSKLNYSQTNIAALQNADTKVADSLYWAGEWKDAIAAYDYVLKKDPANSLAWNRLGYSFQNTMQYDKALEAYQRSLTSKPFPQLKAVVQSRMARTYALKNNKESALIWLDSAVKSGYTNLKELDTLHDYAGLRSDARFKELYAKAYNIAYPCMSDSRAREFDFWVGEWDVYQNGNSTTVVGYSKIEIASGGCMILENWTSMVGAHNGKSMNYFDPQKGKWEQVWVGSEGGTQVVHRFTNGEYKDSAMHFDFEGSDNNGNFIGRFIFYNLGKNKVRQFNEQSYDNGKNWRTNYDFIYIRHQ